MATKGIRLTASELHAARVAAGGSCSCPTCAASGAPAPPDFAKAVRDSLTKEPAPKAAPVVDRSVAPTAPDLAAVIRGGK